MTSTPKFSTGLTHTANSMRQCEFELYEFEKWKPGSTIYYADLTFDRVSHHSKCEIISQARTSERITDGWEKKNSILPAPGVEKEIRTSIRQT